MLPGPEIEGGDLHPVATSILSSRTLLFLRINEFGEFVESRVVHDSGVVDDFGVVPVVEAFDFGVVTGSLADGSDLGDVEEIFDCEDDMKDSSLWRIEFVATTLPSVARSLP